LEEKYHDLNAILEEKYHDLNAISFPKSRTKNISQNLNFHCLSFSSYFFSSF
jgi:hypothetical protein